MYHVEVSEQPLLVETALNFVDRVEHGAALCFVGRVRNHNEGRAVSGVTYDVFAPLAEAEMAKICEEAKTQFGDGLYHYMAHFKGYLAIGGISVIIATGSPHRDVAYLANRFLIEQLKVRVPVWKEEHYIEGDAQWLKGVPVV